MKKFLLSTLALLMIVVLVGCNNGSNATISKTLEKSTDKLSTLINNLDNLQTDEIVIEDISPLASNNSYNYKTNEISKKVVFKDSAKSTTNNTTKINQMKKRQIAKNKMYNADNLLKKGTINVSANKIQLTNNDTFNNKNQNSMSQNKLKLINNNNNLFIFSGRGNIFRMQTD